MQDQFWLTHSISESTGLLVNNASAFLIRFAFGISAIFFNALTSESVIFFVTDKIKQIRLKIIIKLFFIQTKRMNIDTFHMLIYFLASISDRWKEIIQPWKFCVILITLKHESVVHKHRATKRFWYSRLIKRIKKLSRRQSSYFTIKL